MATHLQQWILLHKTDRDVSFKIKSCMTNILRFCGIVRDHGESGLNNVMLAGSAHESGVLSRAFLRKKEKENYFEASNWELELDLEFVLLDLSKSLIDRIEETINNGFVKVRFSADELYTLSLKNGWKFPQEYKEVFRNIVRDGYISPKELKNVLQQNFVYNPTDKFPEAAIALLLNKNVDDIKLECVYPGVITKSSVMTQVIIKENEETFLNFSYDAVVLIRLDWWPEAAHQWITRKRAWPSKNDIKNLSSCCYVIPKSRLPEMVEHNGDNEINFRYTFSHVERKLMSMLSPQQSFVYFLFKSLFYFHVKSLKPDTIQSYCCKTIMLWTCEKFKSNDPFWDGNWYSTMQALAYLFSELSIAFQNGTLRHYFIEQINVIDNIPESLQKTLVQKISTIVSNNLDFVPHNVSKVLKFGQRLATLFSVINETSDALVSNKKIWLFLLKRPVFTAKVVYCLTYHQQYFYYSNIFILVFLLGFWLIFLCLCEVVPYFCF